MQDDLRAHPDALQVCIAGSYRRRKEIVRDLDFIVATNSAGRDHRIFRRASAGGKRDRAGPDEDERAFAFRHSVRPARGELRRNIRLRSNYFTGSKEHNIVMRNRALQRGWTLNEYRLAPAPIDPKRRKKRTRRRFRRFAMKRELYRALDLDYIPPELRENCGEFEAAAEGQLPRLIELENLRGTFHCHTTASDGRNSLEEMAAAAQELGLQYLGIADHSRSSIQAHGLDRARLRAQIAAIREAERELRWLPAFRRRRVRHPARRLARFRRRTSWRELDYVVASVHSAFNLPEAEMTKRIIRAMQQSATSPCSAHPTGRLAAEARAYAVDIPAIIEAAAETGTWIEINAAPKRLDLDWRWWPLAKEKGVKCVINPDAHGVERLAGIVVRRRRRAQRLAHERAT